MTESLHYIDPDSTVQPPGLPLVLATDLTLTLAQLLAAIEREKIRLLELLAQHGAVVLRGFALRTDDDFDAVIQAFDFANFRYADSLSNAVRSNRTERVFTANEAPSHVEIFLHHEMAQTPVYPSRLFFFCEKAPQRGGATPLCRSDLLLEAMREKQPRFLARLVDEGLRYTNVMPAQADSSSGQGRSWTSTLGTEDPRDAERKLADLGYRWAWLDNGNLQVTTPVLPAIRSAPNGVDVFFNQLIAAYKGWNDARNRGEKAVCFGSGEPLDVNDLATTAALAETFTVDLAWEDGDVALIDNFLMMHGRRPFQGERSILASLVADD